MTMRFIVLFLLVCSVLIEGCSTGKVVLPDYIPEYIESTPSKTLHIPYPILLLHGLGQKATVWNKNAITFYEEDLGLHHAGILRPGKKGIKLEKKSNSGFMDFFTVQFSNPVDSVEGWVKELEQSIDFVLENTGADKVILIGYSMGGLTGRHYLTKHRNEHHVQRLITIGSPHQGSAFAKVYNWKTSINKALADGPNFIMQPILEQASELMRAAQSDVPFDAPAIRDLRRPEDGGWFIEQSGKKEHPLDVEYISVIGKVDIMKEVSALNTSGAKELLRRLIGFLGAGAGSLFESGDGVVSASSQTMNELPWFVSHPSRQRISQTITLSSVHEDHLRNSNEIQKLSLEDQPEFKGAEFYRNTDRNERVLVVEYSDYLPKDQSTIEVNWISNSRNEYTIVSPKYIQLVTSAHAGFVKRASIYIPSGFPIEDDIECRISIKNSFGRQCTAIKMWRGIKQ